MNKLVLCILVALTLINTAPAQDAAPKPATKPDKKAEPAKETTSETPHTITVNGAKLEYKATAGVLGLLNDEGKPLANVFFVAYTKLGLADASKRPLTFAFNGGPGSSSVWLHLGLLGPRRVAVGDVGESVIPPSPLVDNQATLLVDSDLVFIDPVSTGFSRPAPGQNAKQFHGVQEDIQSVGAFIRQYVTRYDRWESPKFLAGESYGTTRAAGLAGYLQDQDGMNLSGIALISSVLNFATIRFDEGNDLPYVLYLPTYTATAWYHKKLAADLQADRAKALAEAEQFALGEYANALLTGNKLPSDSQHAVARKLARYTGLSEDYVIRANLRIEISRFTKELLRPERLTIGRFDSRFTGRDLDAVGERSEYDPSYSGVLGPYTAALNQYLRTELKYDSDLPYEILTGKVQPWDFGNAKNRYLNVAGTLRQAMTKNPDLRVFIACGYYDLATPFFASDYTVSHLGLDPGLAEHVRTAYYDAGHMMYIHKPALEKLKKDLTGFVQGMASSRTGAVGRTP
jgi:carboxypeptidase C (cathepsin A)